MLSIGQKFPAYSLTGVVSNDLAKGLQPFTNDSFAGKWQVVFFWPKDFTFVCPTEIAAFGKLEKEFKARDAQLDVRKQRDVFFAPFFPPVREDRRADKIALEAGTGEPPHQGVEGIGRPVLLWPKPSGSHSDAHADRTRML